MDIGATAIFGAVAADRAIENVRSCPTFTQDLCAPAELPVKTTDVNWIPLFQILEARGSRRA